MTDPLTVLYENLSSDNHYELDENGDKVWLDKDGLKHREDGPAFVGSTHGFRSWWIHGKRHNEYGPAIIYTNGKKVYALDNEKISEQEWLKDSRVQRALNFKKLENKDIKDDDFLRTFGSIV